MSTNKLFDKDLKNWIDKFCESKENIQLTIGISSNEEEKIHSFTTDGKEVVLDSSYEIGSITKVITGLLVAKAMKENLLSLDDNVSKYFDFKEKEKTYPTIRGLVTHTSGCSDSYLVFDENSLNNETTLNPFSMFTREEVIASFECQTYTSEQAPPNYSNLGTAIIGLILETVYELPYKTLVRNFLDEYDLCEIQTQVPSNLVNGYTNNKNSGNWLWDNESPFISVGGLYSNVVGLLKLGKLYYSNEDNIFRTSQESVVTVNESPKVDMGLFWGKYSDLGIITHSGSTGCFSSIITIDVVNKRTIVILSNYLDENDLGVAFMQMRKAALDS